MSNQYPLPPLSAIRVFEAAARHGNFTLAAEELGMTQASVSYQIKLLEDRIDAPLFARRARGVELLDAGKQLASRSSEALGILRHAYAEAKGVEKDTLVLGVITTFATTFLVQRLGGFQIQNPQIGIRLETTDKLDYSRTSDIDIAIGCYEREGCHNEFLMNLNFTPMFNPALLKAYGEINKPADLLKLPIVEPSDPWWKYWFTEAGVEYKQSPVKSHVRLGSQVLGANAAIAAQGVGILTPSLYEKEIASGDLCQPFDQVCDDGMAYWLSYPKNHRKGRKMAIFTEWLKEELACIG